MSDRIIDYLIYGYWDEYRDQKARKHFDDGVIDVGRDTVSMGEDGILWVSFGNLTGRTLEYAQKALYRIDDVIPIDFEYVDTNAQINIRTTDDFSVWQSTYSNVGGRDGEFDNLNSADIVVTRILENLTDETNYRIFLHETLHGLGLGHPGPYNGNNGTRIYPEDNTDTTIMSYYRVGEPYDLRIADVRALQDLYGAVAVDDVIELYTAYLDRLPDNEGLEFWTAAYHTGTTLQEMSNLFFDNVPTTMTNAELVNSTYDNVLNRDADLAGLQFWTGLLNDNSISQGDFVYLFLEGVQEQDQQFLDGKTELGVYFALEQMYNDTEVAEQAVDIYEEEGYDSAYNFLVGINEDTVQI